MPPPETPKPGSPEAVAAGCSCPVMDNSHGRGWMGNPNMFAVNKDCPLHGKKEPTHAPAE